MKLIGVVFVCVLGAFQAVHGQASQTGCAQAFGGNAGEFCYFFSHAEATWADAKTICESKGGSLAAIDDPNVQIYMGGYVEYTTKQSIVTLPTANDYHYHYLHDLGLDVTQHTEVTFKVKACHDAHIALSSVKNLDTADTYEVVIGGWSDSKSVIRDCKQCTNMDEVYHTSHPLSCTDFRPFWISWDNHVIRVGTGNDVGQNEFMSWNDTAPHGVNYVAIATGFGSAGNWTFDIQTYSPGKFWVGGQYVTYENAGWLWLPSQTPLSAFQDWAPNEPDNANGNQHCLVLDMHSNMQWRDENCDEKRNFICQTPLEGPSIIG